MAIYHTHNRSKEFHPSIKTGGEGGDAIIIHHSTRFKQAKSQVCGIALQNSSKIRTARRAVRTFVNHQDGCGSSHRRSLDEDVRERQRTMSEFATSTVGEVDVRGASFNHASF